MTDLIPFEYSGRQVRTVLIDGEPWFVAADVCAVLGFRMASDAVRVLDESEKGYAEMRTPGGDQRVLIVNESGLYALIFRSRTDDAKRFRMWITSEVIPSIRKNGSYGTVRELTRLELIDLAREAEVGRLSAVAERDALAPAAQSWHVLAEAAGDYAVREAAQILDRDPSIQTGEKRLFRYLREIPWIDSRNQPYQRHVECGRLVVRTRPYKDGLTGAEQVGTQLRVTPKGLHELHRLLGGSGPVLLEVAS